MEKKKETEAQKRAREMFERADQYKREVESKVGHPKKRRSK